MSYYISKFAENCSANKVSIVIIIIQEDLLKINKNMLKLIQLFKSAWRNKNTERKGKKRKIRRAVVYTTFTKRKTKLKKKIKKLTHKYIQNQYECMMAAK